MSEDGSGRALSQFHAIYGGPVTLRGTMPSISRKVLQQMPYTFQPLVGDIQNLDADLLASMIGEAFKRTEVPDSFDWLVEAVRHHRDLPSRRHEIRMLYGCMPPKCGCALGCAARLLST